MRPIKLTMQAFGPYAAREEIDFRQLENRTMFVISGNTGAGKTTIFDGISYAIYGKSSGEERAGNELRSQFADESILTEVSLEFSLKGRSYEIYRAPQQDKKKERGEGYTTVTAKAELYELKADGEKELIAANVRDVDEKVKEIIQIDANQFRQILMIPQGEFRKLLVSDSKEKEKVLQRLFHTQFYKLIEEKLKKEADQLAERVRGSRQERERLLNSIEPVTEKMQHLLQQEPRNETAVFSQLDEEIRVLRDHLREVQKEINEQQTARDQLNQAIHEAKRLIEQLKHKEHLEETKKELEAQKPLIERKKEDIEWAQRAWKLEQQEQVCWKLKKELDRERERAVQANAAFTASQEALKKAVSEWEEERNREAERSEAAEALNALLALKEQVFSLDEEQAALSRLNKEAKEYEERKAQLSSQGKELEERLEKLEEWIESLDGWQKILYEEEKKKQQADLQIRVLDKAARTNQRLEEYQRQRVKVEQQAVEKRQQLAEAEKNAALLEESWQKQQAGILARALTEGEPCAVCGSTEHPHPASIHLDAPEKNEVEAAKQETRRLEAAKQEAERELDALLIHVQSEQEKVEELEREAKEAGMQVHWSRMAEQKAELMAVHQRAEQERNQAEQQLRQKEKWLAERRQLNAKWKEQREQLEEYQKKELAAREAYAGKQSQVKGLLEKIPAPIREKTAFERAVKQAEAKKKELERRLEEAVQRKQAAETKLAGAEAGLKEREWALKQQEERLDAERDRFVQLQTEQGFKNYKHYADSKRSEDEVKQLQADVNQFNERYRSVSDRLHEWTENLEGVQAPDLSDLSAKKEIIEQQLAEKDQKRMRINHLISNYDHIQTQVRAINEKLKDLEQEYGIIGHLYEISHGKNVHKITFERYVLASFLDDILTVANERLVKMTSGRYTLHRKKDRAKGNAQSGLELLIFDQYTGKERHVKTLSGGESFKAALALALGLAEIVQQYAGGISLETMFIDEGFGTLDSESLDQAIESLMEIQGSGRLVGLISHVPELKERIDARLEVVATQSGSYTRFQLT
ncbi:AAA family ATPase [Bacillus thermotolerans]|uniref:Nuclease SbcCD subunit C n=1 Tax=Bacillus thermotolerans TaxID=1221996 RepID=A0A0F5IBB7_BACTR|nr:AAA family ATPase [Bacillus thermotolerans]KKB42472.1 Exonuclease SbcC [Bacillus thermotolerans]KKB44580.1 Exonuclease SbcC [Bacillus thermotolerans]